MKTLSEKQVAEFRREVPDAKTDVGLSRHTYLKIGGPAKFFVSADNDDGLIAALRAARECSIPAAILGGGSNLLVADAGFEGVVVQNANRKIQVDGTRITAASGAITALVARKSVDAGLAGFEWGVGIPGTVGGAIVGNAGCFGGETGDVIETVLAYDMERDETKTLSSADCAFGYRDSVFKKNAMLVLAVTLRLTPGAREASKEKMDKIVSARTASQPKGAFSAGCLFKNFEIPQSQTETHHRSPSQRKLGSRLDPGSGPGWSKTFRVPAEFIQAGRIPAGWLIEKCGLKGTRVGDAEVSGVHANFIINRGHATADEIFRLYTLIQKRVQEQTGICLENEVRFLGFE